MRSLLTGVVVTAAVTGAVLASSAAPWALAASAGQGGRSAPAAGQAALASLPAGIACPGPQPLRPACGWVYAGPAMKPPARPPAARPGDSGPPAGTITVLALTAAAAAAAAMRTRRRAPRSASRPWPAVVPSGPPGTRRDLDQDSRDHHRRDRYPGHGAASAPAYRQPPAARGSDLPVPVPIALGTRDGHEVTADAAALGGLGLAGPGAPAAARAITAALLTGQHGDAGTPAEIIVPADAAARLLPAPPGHGTRPPARGIRVHATLNAALDETETAIVGRARIAGNPAGPRPAPLVLIAAPGRASWPRLHAIAVTGRDLGVAVVLLGGWPPGTTCHITSGGLVSAVTPPQAGLAGTRASGLTPAGFAALTARLPAGIPGDATDPAPVPPETAQPPPRSTPAARPGTAPRTPAAALPDNNQPAPPQAATASDSTGRGPGQAPVQISVLGPLQVTADGQEIHGGLRKARELLAFLAVHPDGVSGEAISEALWPEAGPGNAAGQRNLALRRAREMLRTATGLTAPMWIVQASGRYRLDPALAGTDLQAFSDALEQARQASGDARLAACRQAVALYRGELAEGAGYEWAEPYAETARRRTLDAWTAIAEILQPRDPDQALSALETALTHDPYNEYLYVRIMRLQASAGRPDAVRRTLALLESKLTDLGITPSSQTRQAAAALLAAAGPAPGLVGSGP